MTAKIYTWTGKNRQPQNLPRDPIASLAVIEADFTALELRVAALLEQRPLPKLLDYIRPAKLQSRSRYD
jgi:hypothetical protein